MIEFVSRMRREQFAQISPSLTEICTLIDESSSRNFKGSDRAFAFILSSVHYSRSLHNFQSFEWNLSAQWHSIRKSRGIVPGLLTYGDHLEFYTITVSAFLRNIY